MKYDYATALSIAYAGFSKMKTQATEGKYTVYSLGSKTFEVRKDSGEVYRVELFTNDLETGVPVGVCDCPFCDMGEENHICKHILFCEDLVAAAAVYRDDSEDFGSIINEAQAQALENARIDEQAREWFESQMYHRYGADAVA